MHCADLSNDGLVYVCDRPNNRLQVFTKEGKFVKEAFFAKKTLGDGAVVGRRVLEGPAAEVPLPRRRQERARLHPARESLEILSSFGDGGRQPGQFFAVHSIATDSKGNLYTTETYQGRRLQKFAFKGVTQVPRDQGVTWPGEVACHKAFTTKGTKGTKDFFGGELLGSTARETPRE